MSNDQPGGWDAFAEKRDMLGLEVPERIQLSSPAGHHSGMHVAASSDAEGGFVAIWTEFGGRFFGLYSPELELISGPDKSVEAFFDLDRYETTRAPTGEFVVLYSEFDDYFGGGRRPRARLPGGMGRRGATTF